MEPLVIDYKNTDKIRFVRFVLSIYFLGFCGYFVFSEAAINRFEILFYTSLIGVVISLLGLLFSTLWDRNKNLLKIDRSQIESNIKGSKFKVDWINVSNVKIYSSSIYIYINGGKKEKVIDLSDIHLKDVQPIKNKIMEACDYKSIVYTNE